MNQPTFILRDEAIRQHAIEFISKLDLKTVWQITIARHRKNRSLNQNSLLWKWYGEIAQDTGNTADDIHEFCKQKFLAPAFIELNGETKEIRRTTTKLNTKEMSEFMNQVEAWAASELGIALPRPEDLAA